MKSTPGALDNASGTVVLLLLAEMLKDCRAGHGFEILAFNGEDHYSAGGQMDYLRRYGEAFRSILLVVNIDDLGYRQARSHPFHSMDARLPWRRKPGKFSPDSRSCFGRPWYQGDHMVLVQQEIPAIAFTSENMAELMRTVTHTAADVPAIIDCGNLVEVAGALNELVRSLQA